MPSLRWLQRHTSEDRPAKLIVGLGNPGPRSAGSRHNVGFDVVNWVARSHRIAFGRQRFQALLAFGQIDQIPVLLAKPQSYMNLSGQAVGKLTAAHHLAPAELLVVYDDLDLPLGKLRLRARGSAGGHHGMESVITHLHSSDFPRLRVGIGRPNPEQDVDHVLGRFESSERTLIEDAITRAAAAVETFVTAGILKAMNEFNRDPTPAP